MKLQRYSVHDVDVMDFILMHGAIWCKDDDVSTLESENAALHAECDRVTAMLGPQKVLSADEVTEPGFYQWRHLDGDPWTVTEVVVNETPELRQYYFGSEEDLELMGQFIGPIKMRGVGDA